MSENISVKRKDLSELADKICEMDGNELDTADAGILHTLLIKVLGPHAHEFYAKDDEE